MTKGSYRALVVDDDPAVRHLTILALGARIRVRCCD